MLCVILNLHAFIWNVLGNSLRITSKLLAGNSGDVAQTKKGSASGRGGAATGCCTCRNGSTTGDVRRGKPDCPAFCRGEAGCVAAAMAGSLHGTTPATDTEGLGRRGEEGSAAACWLGDPPAVVAASACVICRLRARNDSSSPLVLTAPLGSLHAARGSCEGCWRGSDAGPAPRTLADDRGAAGWREVGTTPPVAVLPCRPPRASAARWRSFSRCRAVRPFTHELPKKRSCRACVNGGRCVTGRETWTKR